MINLTNTEISKIEPPDHEQTISDSKITGLKLRIAKNSGIKTFYLYYKIAGKQRKYRIGKFGDIGVPAAREVASKLRAKIALGEDPQLDRLTERKANKQETDALLRTFLESQYYPWAKVHQKAYYRTKQVLEHNFKTFMNKRMDSISKSDIDNWQKLRLSKGKKPSTINREMTSLIAALNKAVEWEIIKFNPLSGRKRLKVDSRGVVRYLSADEEKRLYEALHKRDGNVVLLVPLLLNTGARPKEAFNLKWEDIDLDGKQITLQAAFTKTSQTRYIPINDKLFAVLNAQKSKSGFLFPSPLGNKPIVSIQKAWGNLKTEAGVKNFRLYDCRHTFASKLVMNGVDLYTVAELLGHSNIEMTKVYAHLAPEHLQSAVNVL